MHKHITTNQNNITQKFHKNLKNPKKKKNSKTQNLGLNMHEWVK